MLVRSLQVESEKFQGHEPANKSALFLTVKIPSHEPKRDTGANHPAYRG